MKGSLSIFHPYLAQWFTEQVGRPTAIQNAAWEKIARSQHVLITAPTGSGKTFTAFLWAINEYITGTRTPGHTSLIYISPLKALNNDIQRNLIAPIKELKVRFEKSGIPFMETIAAFIGGYRATGTPSHPSYQQRKISIIAPVASDAGLKRYDIRVRSPVATDGLSPQASIWDPMVDEFRQIIERNRSTLIFTNSRKLCEKLAFNINSGSIGHVAYAHHGSLSREIREDVEKAFKNGRLRTIVATNSLELGIDIGTLDQVLLVQSPPSISSAIQRLGRSGHRVGDISHGSIFPTHPKGFIEAAALVPAILEQDIEAKKPIQNPLDILAQVVISMTGVETWDIDALFCQIKTSYPYRNLNRENFDRVLNMLEGRYAGSRIRELKPRISIDRIDNTVRAKKAALLAVYMSGGTIPDRGYYTLRHSETGARIGELDEEFVWEARIGQSFTLGTQNWKINRLTPSDVLVLPDSPRAMTPPFWKAEEYDRDFHYSDRIASFLEYADAHIDDAGFSDHLVENNHLDDPSAGKLIAFLKQQKEITGSRLPHRHHLLVEHIPSGPGGGPGNQIILHTLWGGQVNRPFAMVLEAAWEERYHQHIDIHADNDCVVLMLPHTIDPDHLQLVLTELASGTIAWSEIHSKTPSPFAQSVSWQQINRYMYMSGSREVVHVTNNGELVPNDENKHLISQEIETELFSQGAGRFDFSTLLRTSGLASRKLSTRLWELVWQGVITNDTFIALRQGIENRFNPPNEMSQTDQTPIRHRRPRGRSRFSKWKAALPSAGCWYSIPYPEPSENGLEYEELKKERIRILLDRYGILFRELLLREVPGFRWPDLFRSLRLMELSGEVLTGYFFHGIPGPQFISPRGFHLLQQGLTENDIYWINASDPASLCGIRLDSLKGTLPKRLPGTHLVYRGRTILLVSRQLGKSLTFHLEPTDPDLERTTGFLHHLLTRNFQPLRQITIESINGIDAAKSKYAEVIGKGFDRVVDFKKIVLYRKRG